MTKTCSECGNLFDIFGTSKYQYKNLLNRNEVKPKTYFQCSYECYTHALLHKEKVRNPEDFNRRVTINEEMMIKHNKVILYPIELIK